MTTEAPQRYWQDIEEGEVLPPLIMQTDLKQAIAHVASGRDFMGGHYDPTYAREQGQPDIYFNTFFYQSLVDRLALDWAGPDCFLARRKISMRASIYAGDLVKAEGRVTRRYVNDHGKHAVELEVTLGVGGRLCCNANATLYIPLSDLAATPA